MAPVAAILCGKNPKMSEFMIKNLAPKIEGKSSNKHLNSNPLLTLHPPVVHVCSTLEDATKEIPALLAGETPTPSSGLGSNAEGSSRSDVSMIIIGGGYSKDDFQAIKSAADAVKPVAIFVADVSKTVGPGPPAPGVIKERMMESIEKEEKGEGEWAPGMYMY